MKYFVPILIGNRKTVLVAAAFAETVKQSAEAAETQESGIISARAEFILIFPASDQL